MELSKVFNSKEIALNYTTAASNNIPYIGSGFFPAQKKAGLDLKWIKGHNGLPVSLMPSTFDAKATLRDRIGIQLNETEMPFFREAMLIKEADRQEIMRVQDSFSPYAQQVLDRIFDDANTLISGAAVVPERMIMQLLAPLNGDVKIAINANNVDYSYDYDSGGSWKQEHYAKITSPSDKWTAFATSDPIADLETAIETQEGVSGNRPEILLMSKTTFDYIKKSDNIKNYILAQNAAANVYITAQKVRTFIEDELGVKIVVYSKQFKDESGTVRKFYPDNIVMMLPNSAVGSTWYGTTPEEADLMESGTDADVSIVNTGVAVTVITHKHPVNKETIVSEIVLPSFEKLDFCYALEVA